jgi:hypothetical protein
VIDMMWHHGWDGECFVINKVDKGR